MNNILILMILSTLFSALNPSRNASDQSGKKTDKWFEKKEWLEGWKSVPDESIDRRQFSESYRKHRERWEKAFQFLRDNDFGKMELKRYDILGDELYATVSRYLTKDAGEAAFEAHRKYIDIQYVTEGKEWIGIAPLSYKRTMIQPYDAEKDIEFMTVSGGTERLALPGRFFIFFPSDAHKPGLADGSKGNVLKIVVKVKAD